MDLVGSGTMSCVHISRENARVVIEIASLILLSNMAT